MEASKRIRDAVSQVSEMRQRAHQSANLSAALTTIKDIQAKRFSNTYRDMLESPIFSGCARFFLEELYSERDYSHRDAQFAKVAKAIELTFPAQVVEIAVTLAELHKTTEDLDLQLAQCWASLNQDSLASRYLAAWNQVGQRNKREWQLETVLTIGRELSELTRKRGLRLLLRMMRKPAELAGLGDLQNFLETGFDEFSQLSRDGKAVSEFLRVIGNRETNWISNLFETNNIARKSA